MPVALLLFVVALPLKAQAAGVVVQRVTAAPPRRRGEWRVACSCTYTFRSQSYFRLGAFFLPPTRIPSSDSRPAPMSVSAAKPSR